MRLLLALACGLLLAAPAFAGQVPIHLTLQGGGLSLRAAGTGPTRHLTLTDARGNGHGWRLVGSSRAALKVTSVTVRCVATCTLPRTLTSYPVTLAGGSQTVLEALPETGMGQMRVDLDLSGLGAVAFALRDR
jgi:hypothetical protein